MRMQSAPAFNASTAARPALCGVLPPKMRVSPFMSMASVTTMPWKPSSSFSSPVLML